ncbi:MAG: DUF2924 domain-containing protein [Candidatus Enterousia sp.]
MTKTKLPMTLDALRAMPFADRMKLWAKYSPHPFKRQMRALWYYVQCDRQKLRIEPKFLAKIKKYKDNPAECAKRAYQNRYFIRPGAVITRTFRGIEHRVMANDDGTFCYNDKTYRTLSGIAREIAGIKISGPKFFGLDKGGKNAK